MHVAAGFMPAFKYRQKNSLIVFERGHKARGYVQTVSAMLNSAAEWSSLCSFAILPAIFNQSGGHHEKASLCGGTVSVCSVAAFWHDAGSSAETQAAQQSGRTAGGGSAHLLHRLALGDRR